MALLVLLARTAPAGVVATDLVPVALDDGLGDVGTGGAALAATRGGRICQLCPSSCAAPRRRDLRQGRRLCFDCAARVVERSGVLRRGERLLGLGGGDIDLHVEDQPAELLPD